ncbi:choice-of-anchor D domain-containing protein [Namhaeicola litoreus]|uniref:Choice-of-anchor D domain-containing protein n=1 Tax=Namhaeicola litoreus TaxID=1052145 RepID=A0ABW3Y7L3_9FLAO
MKTLRISLVLFLFLTFYQSSIGQELNFYEEDGILLIPEDGTNFPEPGAYTHFGDVPFGSSKSIKIVVKVEQFLLFPFMTPRLYESYDSNGNPANPYTENEFVVSQLTPVPNPLFVLAGSEFSFTITFQPQSNGVKDIIVDLKPLLTSNNNFNMRGVGLASEIEIVHLVNGQTIINNSQPSQQNGTYMGTLGIGNSKTNQFLIKNEGNSTLTINQWNLTGSSNFQLIHSGNNNVDPGESITFEVRYTPNNEITHNATLTLEDNDPDEGTFVMNFSGKGTAVPANFGKLMITQTYENGNSDFVEVKNISGGVISNIFYLARYNRNRNTSSNPNVAIQLGTFQIDEVKSIPFSFDSDQLIVISTSNNNTCYANRIDMVGEQNGNWAPGKSLVKSNCTSISPHLDFSLTDWQELSLSDVNSARNDQNLKLGIHYSGESIWNNNWINGFPDRTRVVRISSPYNNSTPFKSCDLIIDEDLNFDHNTNQSIEIYRNLTVSNGQFTIGDTESLMMYNDFASISGSIKKIEKTTNLQRVYDATYWSSPVQNANLQSVFSGVNKNRMFQLDPSKKNQIYLNTAYEHWFIASGNMKVGKGYSIDGKQIGINTFTFNGKPNNGKISTQIFFNSGTGVASNDFNLVGNPYPSAIDPMNLIQANSNVFDGAIYLWTHQIDADQGGNFSSNDYIVYNLAGSQYNSVPTPFYISSGQGFMVNAIKTDYLQFDNSMRLTGNNQYFYKEELSKNGLVEKDRVWLKIVDQNKYKKEMMIGFFEEATSGYDLGYDAKLYPGAGLKIFSLAGDDLLSIQSVEKNFESKEIRVGFSTDVEQDLYFGLAKLEGELRSTEIYLIDHKLNVEHNLKLSDYHFHQIETGTILDRFSIKFNSSAVLHLDDKLSDQELIRIKQNVGFIALESIYAIEQVELFDLGGRELSRMEGNEKNIQFSTASFKPGTVLLLKVGFENGLNLSKKVILYQ